MEQDRETSERLELGLRIRSLRERQRLTQIELSAKCKVNHADISRIENGQQNIEFSTLIKLAEVFNVELFDLFKKEKKI